MKQVIILTMISLMFVSTAAYAKRMAPKKVAPVKSGHIEYRAPLSAKAIGTVEAWDTKKNKLLWTKKIYTIKYNENLERDVQWVFIKSLRIVGNKLIITNERGGRYKMDLKTLKVEADKG